MRPELSATDGRMFGQAFKYPASKAIAASSRAAKLVGAIHQFSGANAQDLRSRSHHLARGVKANAQMVSDRNQSLPHTKTAIDGLPPPDIKRWTARLKAAIVKAVLTA